MTIVAALLFAYVAGFFSGWLFAAMMHSMCKGRR